MTQATVVENAKRIGVLRESMEEKDYYLITTGAGSPSMQPGIVRPVTRAMAAEFLVKGTHREATAKEIAAFNAVIDKQTAEYAEIEVKGKQQFALPQDLSDLVKALAGSAAQSHNNHTSKPKGDKD